MVDGAVRFAQVVKRFGAVAALDGVTFSVAGGEVVALPGPNGAGKSTAMSLMLGLRDADEGTVEMLGGPAEQALRSGHVGAMLQSGGLPLGLRVRELVDFVRGLYPHPLPADELLCLAGCVAFAGQMVERISGGEAQRLRFVMAIAGDPQLVFLDEPTTGFDVDARRHCWNSIRAFAASGRTVLFATHYLEEADAGADGSSCSSGGMWWPTAVRLATADPDTTVRAAVRRGIPFRHGDRGRRPGRGLPGPGAWGGGRRMNGFAGYLWLEVRRTVRNGR